MADIEVISAPAGFDDGTAFAPPVAETTPETPSDEALAADGEPTPEAPPVPAAPPAPEPPFPAIDPRGILRDLQAERQARQEAQQRADRLQGQLEGMQMEQRRGPQAPTPLSPEVTSKATAWAHRWGLYTSDGQPDIQAAANALDELRNDLSGDVDARVTARVQPVVQVLQQAHAQAKIADIVRVGSEFGADPAVLQAFASNLASIQPDALNDQNVVVGLIGLARGMSSLSGPSAPAQTHAAVPAVAPTPNLTERPGGRLTTAPALSGIERTIASKRGMSNEKWASVSKEFEKMDPTRGLVVEKD